MLKHIKERERIIEDLNVSTPAGTFEGTIEDFVKWTKDQDDVDLNRDEKDQESANDTITLPAKRKS